MIPDRWLGVVAGAPDSGAAGLLAAELVRRGARAVVERADGTLVTHFPPPVDVPAFLVALGSDLNRAAGRPVDLHWHWQPHEEWATRRALRLLDTAVRPGAAIADVGTGSGILAIAAARLGVARVLAADNDPLACAAARDNVGANRVGEVVEIHEREVSPAWLMECRPLDGVAANIESGVLTSLLPGFAAALAPGGWLLASGLLAEQSGDFAYEAAPFGYRLRDDDAEDGWWAGTFRLGPDRADG